MTTTQTIELDRRLTISELISDLAVILGPDPDLPSSEYRVAILGTLRKMLYGVEDEIAMYVRGAIRDGATWQEVGDALNISRQAAHKRFSNTALRHPN